MRKVITMLKKLTSEINEKKRKYDRDYELIELRNSMKGEETLIPELMSPTLMVNF